MRLSSRATRRSPLLRLCALLAGVAACWRLPTAPGDGAFPCLICPVTTDLRIAGDSAVAVGDTLRLRAIAYQQNIVFQGGTIPSRTAVWTVTPAGSAGATLVVVRATADTATWGRALLIGRAAGTLVVQAREGNIEATRTVAVLAAAEANVMLSAARVRADAE
ncbi:MAG: hypothetical protein ACJ79S_04300 [Gemmatimonadaceae bacterium]